MIQLRSLILALLLIVPAALGAASPLYTFAEAHHRVADKKDDVTRGNYVGVIDDGYQALVLRVHLIRAARHTIDIQTFILENDECGRLLMYELIQAAARGVKVRLLADHFMSSKDRDFVAFLATAHPNFELKYYRPPAKQIDPDTISLAVSHVLFFRGQNQRMHNKLFLIDNMIALMGGRNIDNHYYNHSLTYNFLDRDALVIGPLLPDIGESFEEFWKDRRSIPAANLLDVARVIERNEFNRPADRAGYNLNGFFDDVDADASNGDYIRTRFVDRFYRADKAWFNWDPPGKNSSIGIWGGGRHTKEVRDVMRGTESSLVIQSPYLILDRSARWMFRRMRKRNPTMDIIVATNSFAATDNTLAYSANFKLRSVYIEKLQFQVHEIKPHPEDLLARLPNYADLERRALEKSSGKPFVSIHAKSFVRDARIAYIGTFNIDPRSENLNSEMGLFVEDARVAKAVQESILSTTGAGSSWVIAKRQVPLAEVNALLEGLSGLSPVDIWPLKNTSSFELIPGKEPVPTDHEDFYANYRSVGSFPGSDGVSSKEIVTYLYKVMNTLAIPLM
ncbi:MAG: hypothetical protein AMXMBFR84_38160 [Candidatus Hydrogenedentota bacterium]